MAIVTESTQTITFLGSNLPSEVFILGYGIETWYILGSIAVIALIQTAIVVKKYKKMNS